jgi:hypothetical protein
VAALSRWGHPLISRAFIAAARSFVLPSAAVLLIVQGSCEAQSIAVPVEMHLPLLTKVIEYDRSFRGKINGVVRLGVAYQKSWRPSAAVFDELVAVTGRGSFAVCGFPVQVIPLDVSGDADVAELLKANSIDLMYVAPLRGVPLKVIVQASEERQFRTITGVPQYVESGVAIGIDLRNDRPLIVINLPAAKASGADLSAQILRLARVVE